MTRQLDQIIEVRSAKNKRQALLALYGGLEAAVARSGGDLVGLGVRFNGADVLMTIKAEFPAGRQVAFVGGESLDAVFRKGMYAGERDELQWREDRYMKS